MNVSPVPRPWGALRLVSPVLCLGLLVGCQTYSPIPLDLSRHSADLGDRLATEESIRAFSQRLEADHPDRSQDLDLTDGIDAAEAEVIALFYNPDLRLARLRAGIALANAENAGLWEDPVFGFDGAELLSPSGPFEFGLNLSLTIPVSGVLEVEQDRANALYDAQWWRVLGAEWSMRTQVRDAWANWATANERLALVNEIVQAVEGIGVISSRLEDAGELTRLEARLFQAQHATARMDRGFAEAEAEKARLDIVALMGLSPDSAVSLVPSTIESDIPDGANDIERLIQTNTDLAVLRADYQSAEETLRLEVRKQYPDIEIGAGLGSEDDDDRLLLGAAIPLPVFNANRGGIAEARANRELARAAAETEFVRLAFQLKSTRARLVSVQQRRKILEQELVPMLDEQAEDIDRLAGLGEFDTFILLETVNRRFEAKNQILALHLQELQGRIEIIRLLGPAVTPQPALISDRKTQSTKNGSNDIAEGVSP